MPRQQTARPVDVISWVEHKPGGNSSDVFRLAEHHAGASFQRVAWMLLFVPARSAALRPCPSYFLTSLDVMSMVTMKPVVPLNSNGLSPAL